MKWKIAEYSGIALFLMVIILVVGILNSRIHGIEMDFYAAIMVFLVITPIIMLSHYMTKIGEK